MRIFSFIRLAREVKKLKTILLKKKKSIRINDFAELFATSLSENRTHSRFIVERGRREYNYSSKYFSEKQ